MHPVFRYSRVLALVLTMAPFAARATLIGTSPPSGLDTGNVRIPSLSAGIYRDLKNRDVVRLEWGKSGQMIVTSYPMVAGVTSFQFFPLTGSNYLVAFFGEGWNVGMYWAATVFTNRFEVADLRFADDGQKREAVAAFAKHGVTLISDGGDALIVNRTSIDAIKAALLEGSLVKKLAKKVEYNLTHVCSFPAPIEKVAPVPPLSFEKVSIATLQQFAERCDAKATFELAERYQHGRGVGRNLDKALFWYQVAAAAGKVEGLYEAGLIYGELRNDVELNRELSDSWIRGAAERDLVAAQRHMYRFYRDGSGAVQPDPEQAVSWLKRAAALGDPESRFYLGRAYETGWGIEQDFNEAVKLYRQLAEQEFSFGENSLGEMYESGQGVTKDYAEAFDWYRRAAEQGNTRAQYNLGNSYAFGRGVKQNYAEAAKWYRLAASQGQAEAQYNLGVMSSKGLGVPKSDAEATKWHHLAADQGYASAQFNLAVAYALGLGVQQDKAEAFKWYRLAAEQGLLDAKYQVGYYYEKGIGVEQDYAQASQWYQDAADHGSALAQNDLGVMYVEGRGVPKDMAKAKGLFQLAANQGNKLGQQNLDAMLAWQDGQFVRGMFEIMRAGRQETDYEQSSAISDEYQRRIDESNQRVHDNLMDYGRAIFFPN